MEIFNTSTKTESMKQTSQMYVVCHQNKRTFCKETHLRHLCDIWRFGPLHSNICSGGDIKQRIFRTTIIVTPSNKINNNSLFPFVCMCIVQEQQQQQKETQTVDDPNKTAIVFVHLDVILLCII